MLFSRLNVLITEKSQVRSLGKHFEVVSSALDGLTASPYSLRLFEGSLGAFMRSPRQDSETAMVVASRLVHQITSIALEMALPAGAGFWLDRRWGTSPWLMLVGAGLGLLTAGFSFAQFVKRLAPPSKSSPSSSETKTTDNSGPSSL